MELSLENLALLAQLVTPLDAQVRTPAAAENFLMAWPALRSATWSLRHESPPAWLAQLPHVQPLPELLGLRALIDQRAHEALGVALSARWEALRWDPDYRPELLDGIRFEAQFLSGGPDDPSSLGLMVKGPSTDHADAFRLVWAQELVAPSGPLQHLLGILANSEGPKKITVAMDSHESILAGFLTPAGYAAYRADQLEEGLPEATPSPPSRPRF